MSKSTKITLWIVVVVVVAGAIWWWSAGQSGLNGSPAAYNNPGNGNSTADLTQNLAQIDSQMSGFSSDSTSMNEALNDQPVTQAQL